MATVGYQVLIPDAIHHGERNPLKNYGVENTIEYFWDIILNNLEEGDILVEELISKYKAHPERIGVMGHSMGGITAAGVFTHNPRLKTLVVLNGSCAWGDLNERFKNDFSLDMDTKKLEGLINRVDPINNLDLLVDRSILLQNAASDEVVPPESQEVFYKKIVSLYKEHNRIKLLKYPNLNHFVTTNMIDDSISWLHKYL